MTHTPDPLAELHQRYDGLIPEDARRRADGIDPVLGDAKGAVRFWRDQVDEAKAALDANTRPERRAALDETWVYARAGLLGAEKRLASLESPDPDAGPKAFFNHITRGV